MPHSVLPPPALSPDADAALVHQKIKANCLSGSWFAMRPVLQQLQSAQDAGPELLADLLASAGARSRHEAERLQRVLSQRSWRASGTLVAGPRQSLTVRCGAASWTLQMLVRPQLHLETIVRNARTAVV